MLDSKSGIKSTRGIGDCERTSQMKYALLWLLGVPIPVLIIGYLIFH